MFVRGEAAAGSFLWPVLFFADLPVAILAFGIGGSLNPDNPVSISLTIWAILGTLWWYLLGTLAHNRLRRRRSIV
jgi:hypothetical protein